ncbi:MAG: NUDIX domain-containing protein [Nanoarchaeota archaeon]
MKQGKHQKSEDFCGLKVLVKTFKYRKAVFIVTYYHSNKNKILYLILKRKLHWKGWEFPKGGINNSENLINAVKRELKEETGQTSLKIKNHHFSGKYKYPQAYPDRTGIIGQTYNLFSAEVKNKKIILDKKEHTGYKWLSFDKAIKKLTYDNQKKCLRKVNKELG